MLDFMSDFVFYFSHFMRFNLPFHFTINLGECPVMDLFLLFFGNFFILQFKNSPVLELF